jgi:hypothetical protein
MILVNLYPKFPLFHSKEELMNHQLLFFLPLVSKEGVQDLESQVVNLVESIGVEPTIQ